MATGAEAVERFAAATGQPEVAVARVARVLKEYEPAVLWPKSGKGGGKKAKHVNPADLVRLLLGVAVAEPITSAPEKVQLFGGLRPENTHRSWTETRTKNGETLISTFVFRNDEGEGAAGKQHGGGEFGLGVNLSAELQNLITMCATPLGFGPEVRQNLRDTWECILTLGTPGVEPTGVSAEIRMVGLDRVRSCRTYSPASDLLPGLPEILMNLPRAHMRRTVRVPFTAIEVLGEIFADTVEHLAAQTPALPYPKDSESAPSAEPEKTKAAEPGSPSGFLTGQQALAAPTSLTDVEPNLSPESKATVESRVVQSRVGADAPGTRWTQTTQGLVPHAQYRKSGAERAHPRVGEPDRRVGA